VAGLGHDRPLGDARLRGRRGESGAQGVPTIYLWIEAGCSGRALDDARHAFIRGRLTKRKLLYAKAGLSRMGLQYPGNHAVKLRTHGPIAHDWFFAYGHRNAARERDHDA